MAPATPLAAAFVAPATPLAAASLTAFVAPATPLAAAFVAPAAAPDAAAAAFFCASSSASVTPVICVMASFTGFVASSTAFFISVASFTSSPTVPARVAKGTRGPVTLASALVPAVTMPVVIFSAAFSAGFIKVSPRSFKPFSTTCDMLVLNLFNAAATLGSSLIVFNNSASSRPNAFFVAISTSTSFSVALRASPAISAPASEIILTGNSMAASM